MNWNYFILGLMMVLRTSLLAQVIIGTNSNPQSSSILQLESGTQGFKLPQMTATERLNIASPAEGLIVFQNTSPSGVYVYTGSSWKVLNANDTSLISIYVENSGGQTINQITYAGLTSWDVPFVDNSSGAWNRTTGVFKAPRDMKVWVSGRITFGIHNQANAFEYGAGIWVNSNNYTPFTYAFSSGSTSSNYKSLNGINGIISLNSGDELQLWTRHSALNSFGNPTALTTHSNGTYLLIKELPNFK